MKKGVRDIFMICLGAVIVVGFFMLMYFLVYIAIPETNKQILNLVIGALIASFSTIVNFYFGSSKGSQDKSEMMNPPETGVKQ